MEENVTTLELRTEVEPETIENELERDPFDDYDPNIEKIYSGSYTLEDTIPLMLHDDYRVRFLAEYAQTKLRYNNLHKMIVKMDAGTLEFQPKASRILLLNQKSHMGNYLNQLEIRAEVEGIRLP